MSRSVSCLGVFHVSELGVFHVSELGVFHVSNSECFMSKTRSVSYLKLGVFHV